MKQTILFLRNASLFGSKEAALAAIKSVNHVAGQPVVALYGSEGSVKMIFAIGTEAGKCNILANDSDLSELASLVSGLRTDLGTSDGKGAAFARIIDLERNVGSLLNGDGSVESQISAAIEALKGTGFKAGTLAALEDKVDANTDAIAKLKGKVDEEGSIAKAIADSAATTKAAYEAADASLKEHLEGYANQAEANAIAAAKGIVEGLAVSESGKYVSKIEKDDDGKVKATLKQIEASEVAVKDEEGHFAAENVEAALHELYTQAGAGSKVTMKSEAGEGDIATIYTFYQGGEDADHKIGEINIGKEMFIESGEVFYKEGSNVPYLKLVLNDTKGTVLEIDLTKVLDVYEPGEGINVVNNVISVKRASDDEGFLFVDENGVAIKGVISAISTAKNEAIAAAKTETENQVKAAKEIIDNYTVNGKKISETPVLGGDDIEYSTGVTVNTKIDAVDDAVADEKTRAEKKEGELAAAIEAAQAAASTVIEPKADGHVTVSEQTAADGHKIYTISEKDIASAQDLTDEIARAKKAEADILDVVSDLNDEVAANNGKVMVADGGDLGYLANKLVSGTAVEDNNIYAVSVNASGDKLNLTCKIDVIDGGTY